MGSAVGSWSGSVIGRRGQENHIGKLKFTMVISSFINRIKL